jgi:hypothetical protein
MTMTERSSSSQTGESSFKALDVKRLRSIQLTTGWVNVKEASITHFGIGEAHSPVMPAKVVPTLRYRDQNGKQIYTPLSQILSFSEDDVSGIR